jgi:hypothetical protein
MKSSDMNAMVAERIAKKFLGIETLTTQNNDGSDFHEISVWSLKEALIAAYKQGCIDGRA